MFNAILLTKSESFAAQLSEVDESSLPEGDVTVRVEYSTLNYKDALAITNRSPVVRNWPMVAGIDGAGTVIESSHPDWKVGDRFVHNGWGVGETRWGCLAEKARLKGEWLVHLPKVFTTRQAMAIGTAGYTAMLCVMALEDHGVTPTAGEILVTGATGGVGSVAVALLGKLGYTVVAATGKASEEAVSEVPGCTFRRPARQLVGCRQAVSEGTLGRRRRRGRLVDAGQRHCADPLRWRRDGLWPGAGYRPCHDRAAIHPARRHARRHRLGHGAADIADRCAWDRLARDLDPALLETMVEDVPLVCGDRQGCATDGWQGSRAHRRADRCMRSAMPAKIAMARPSTCPNP